MYPCSASSDRSSQDGESGSEDYDPTDILSEDEGASPDPSPFVGLFDPALFKALLLKACTSAKISPDPEPQPAPPNAQDSNPLFSEPVVTQRHIPCPPFFRNTIQKQWATPGTLPVSGSSEKRLFNVAPSLSDILKVPLVDES